MYHGARATLAAIAAMTALLMAPASLDAQADTARKDSIVSRAAGANCDSVLRAARVDSVDTDVRVYLLRKDGEAIPSTARRELMAMLRAHLELPSPLQLPVFGPGPARLRMLRPERLEGDAPRAPVLYGVYALQLRRDLAARVGVEIPTLAPGVDSSIVRAIRALSTDSVSARILRSMRRDAVDLQLRLTSGAPDGRLRVPSDRIFTGTFPRVRITDGYPDADNLAPEYPLLERVEGADGEVLIRVVIDADGMPVISTAEVLHSTSPLFSLSALRSLATYGFTPARVGACPVPQAIEIPFWFSLRP
jgi:hypothetical protein